MAEEQVTQTPNPSDRLFGGAPNTTSVVNGTISPNAPQAAPVAATPQPAAPSAPSAPTAPSATRPALEPMEMPTPRSLHSRIFDGVLNTLGGGPMWINQTDPTTGETRRVAVPQSRGQLGKSILAGALAGMFGGMDARDPSGRHDPLKAAQQGFQAAGAMREKQQEALQKTSDEDISRRQMVMKNNFDLMHQQIAMTHQAHIDLQETADRNNAGILKDAGEFDAQLTGGDANDRTKRAITDHKLTYEQALAKLGGRWSENLAIVDGYQDVKNPVTGMMEAHPTYALLNPNVSIKMSEAQAKEFSRFKRGYENAYQATDGNLAIPMARYVADTHQLNSLEQMEAFFNRSQKELGLKDVPDFASVVRDGGPTAMAAVLDAQNALGQKGDAIDALSRLSASGGGALILNKMGMSNEKVEALVNEKIRKNALAKEGGIGEKAPESDETIDKLLHSLDASLVPQEVKDTITADAHKDKEGHYNLNKKQGEDLRNRILTAQNQANQINERNLLANGDPEQMKKTAQNTIEGDVNDVTKIASMRGNARENSINAIHDQAAALGLDTTNYSEAALQSQADMWKDYRGGQNTKTGKQLVSFDGFIGHTGEALARQQILADKIMGLKHTPIANMTMKELGKQFTDDKDWAAYSASLVPVKHEIENFLAAGFATKSNEEEDMRAILNDTMPINRMNGVLRQLADTADVRLAALGKAYTHNMGRNFPTLLSPESKRTLDKLGVKSKAADYGSPLPRGWNNHQMQKLTDVNVAVRFLQAAGGDRVAASELMKRNGWLE